MKLRLLSILGKSEACVHIKLLLKKSVKTINKDREKFYFNSKPGLELSLLGISHLLKKCYIGQVWILLHAQ